MASRTNVVSIKLTDAEVEALDKACERTAQGRSDFVRDAVLASANQKGGMEEIRDELSALRHELSKLHKMFDGAAKVEITEESWRHMTEGATA